MFSVLPAATVMPSSANSEQPSQRIRCTVPLTVTRSEISMLLLTTYQLPSPVPFHTVVSDVISVKDVQLPFFAPVPSAPVS